MADLILLPSTTYRPPSPPGRRRGRALNPIIEEEHEDRETAKDTMNTFSAAQRRRRNNKSVEKIEQWLSPMSDHFPTPRGMHFLAAPVLPATPSCLESDSEVDDASSETSSSIPSTNYRARESVMTDATEFDDIYDVSDEEKSRKEQLRSSGINRRPSTRSTRSLRRASADSRKVLAPLVIPVGHDAGTDKVSGVLKKITSPVPPTPPSRVEMSPAMKSFMEAQQILAIPTISAPPSLDGSSLDGSLNSEELAAMSAPPTPQIGCTDEIDNDWSGVRLQPAALETLHALSSSGEEDYSEEPSPVIEVPQEMSEMRQPPRLITSLPRASMVNSHSQQRSLAGLTKLDIPSPGGFFSELSSATRRTWSMSSEANNEIAPPTSTTAEQFYKAPWNSTSVPPPPPPPPPPRQLPLSINADDPQSAIVERVMEFPSVPVQDLPTAIRIQPTPEPITARKVPPPTPQKPAEFVEVQPVVAEVVPVFEHQQEPEEEAVEIVVSCDPEYARKQLEVALSHLDRTELWLKAQQAYLHGVAEFSAEDEETELDGAKEIRPAVPEKDTVVSAPAADTEVAAKAEPEPATLTKKKTVRFSEAVLKESIPRSLPSKLLRQESAYYRAFADMTVRAHTQDAFVHKQPRFEALQASRVSLAGHHRNQLLGKFQLSVVPQSAKKRMSANVARGDDVIVDDPEKLRADKEAEALSQMDISTWHVAATKLLNGGRLIAAPVAKRLARLSRTAPDANGVSQDRARILDLAGQGTCDWAWHVALQYPNTKVYTVTTKAIRQLSNSNIRGPPNHRQVAIERLTKLPFEDGQFDLVSAREIHAVLKLFGENGVDEWEACLRECYRVLKPGGYIEFSVLDADIVNAGPLGNKKAVEFGFALNTLGYDPNPTRAFLPRLTRAGFEDVRRAWLVLPVGPKKPPKHAVARDSTGAPVPTVELEAIVSGSVDNVAAVTGLAAGWSWERWLLRTEMEKAAGELRLVDSVTPGDAMAEAGKMVEDVHAIVEEGRNVGSGYRLLRGYAKKPNMAGVQRMGTINMCFQIET